MSDEGPRRKMALIQQSDKTKKLLFQFNPSSISEDLSASWDVGEQDSNSLPTLTLKGANLQTVSFSITISDIGVDVKDGNAEANSVAQQIAQLRYWATPINVEGEIEETFVFQQTEARYLEQLRYGVKDNREVQRPGAVYYASTVETSSEKGLFGLFVKKRIRGTKGIKYSDYILVFTGLTSRLGGLFKCVITDLKIKQVKSVLSQGKFIPVRADIDITLKEYVDTDAFAAYALANNKQIDERLLRDDTTGAFRRFDFIQNKYIPVQDPDNRFKE